MAGEFSDVGSGYALDIVTGRAAGPGARTTYLALLSAAPTDTSTTGAMNEISTAGYARQSVAWDAPALVGGVPTTDNTSQITFGPFSADPPNVTHCALVSSSSGSGGDFIFWWALDTAKDAAINESIQFNAGALTIALD